MWIQNFVKTLTSTRRRPTRRRPPASRLRLEQLEDRSLPSNFTAATGSDLIADINAANQQGGPNTIALVAPSISPYTLTAVDNTTDGATGLPVIAANDNLTIIGNGDTIERSTAAGTPAFRLFDVASGAALTLENLTLQGGQAYGSGVSAAGGAIYSQGSLTLNGVTVQGNTARGGDGMLGGGIDWDAPAGSDGLGGGLYAAGGTVTITSSILSDNQALGGNGGNGYSVQSFGFNGGNGGNGLGGAVYVAAGTFVMTSDTMSADTAQGGRGGHGGWASTDYEQGVGAYGGAGGDGGYGGGGAVSVAAGTVVMSNDTLFANTAQGGQGGDGGGTISYYWGGSAGNGGAGATGVGGGLYVAGGTVTLAGATVSSNSAFGGTGGLGGVGDNTPSGHNGNLGLGQGGGLKIAPAAPPLVDMDTYTVSNTINNFADIDPNIAGLYSLNGTSTQPSTFTVSGFPSSTTAGVAGTFTVMAEYADGTTDIRYRGTVHFSGSDVQAGLPADYTFTAADAGVQVFSATLKTAGSQALTAIDTTTATITGSEAGIAVNPAAATQFAVRAPAGSTAGSAFSVTLTALDPFNNSATGCTGAVHFTSSDGQALLPANYAFTAADAGVHAFTGVILKTAGSQTVTATDTLTSSITRGAAVAVNPAPASTMIVTGFPSPTTAGVAGNFTVRLKDPYGNTAGGYAGTVHFTSSDGKASLPANYTFTAADAGVHTFSATLKTAGTQSLTADTTTASLTGTDGGITVKPAAASRFILSAPASVSAGVPFSLTLTIKDAYGNVVIGYTGRIHFTSTDRTATLPANYTFTAADKGVHTFSGLVLRKRGTQKITLTDTLNSSLTGSVIENVL